MAQGKAGWQEVEDSARPQKVMLWSVTGSHLGAIGKRTFGESQNLPLGYELEDRAWADADEGLAAAITTLRRPMSSSRRAVSM